MASPQERDFETLIARIAASRAAVASDIAHMRHRLDWRSRVKESILSKPLAWLGGSLGAGFLTSMILKRRRRPAKAEEVAKKSLWTVLLGGAFALARPALQSWAVREFQTRFAQPRYSQDKHS